MLSQSPTPYIPLALGPEQSGPFSRKEVTAYVSGEILDKLSEA